MTDKELLKKFNEFLEENKTNFVNQINKEDKNLILDFIFYVVLKAERKEIMNDLLKKVKDMPENFPELESDIYDIAYKEAKEYLLKLLK